MNESISKKTPQLSINDIQIAIAVHKNDVWFCRICVASIRHFYPDIEIVLLKDELNGRFSTEEIEQFWNVKLFDLGKKEFGWAASKIFFTLLAPEGKQCLILDSDIILVGPLLERLLPTIQENDIVLNAEYYENPYADWVPKTYFDVKAVQEFDRKYEYPGYFFNTGQLFIKGNSLKIQDYEGLFNPDHFPYWTNLKLFPLVDQSVYNYIFPKLEQERKIKIGKEQFMLWSQDEQCMKITIDDLNGTKSYPYMIHWAGDIRTAYLSKMKHRELLNYFEHKFYKAIPFGWAKRYLRRVNPILKFYELKLRQSIRSIIRK